jgi:hypothetical protein
VRFRFAFVCAFATAAPGGCVHRVQGDVPATPAASHVEQLEVSATATATCHGRAWTRPDAELHTRSDSRLHAAHAWLGAHGPALEACLDLDHWPRDSVDRSLLIDFAPDGHLVGVHADGGSDDEALARCFGPRARGVASTPWASRDGVRLALTLHLEPMSPTGHLRIVLSSHGMPPEISTSPEPCSDPRIDYERIARQIAACPGARPTSTPGRWAGYWHVRHGDVRHWRTGVPNANDTPSSLDECVEPVLRAAMPESSATVVITVILQ